MSRKVNSFKRLYRDGRFTKEKIQELFNDGTITQEEYEYIMK